MPHIVVEYSAGAGSRLDISQLLRTIHRAALDSGHFKPNVVRTFGREATVSLVADEHPANHFVQILMRIAPGRDAATKQGKRQGDPVFRVIAA